MTVVAAVLAAGSGTRFGGDKTAILLRGKPVWQWSVDAYLAHAQVDRVILVTAADRVSELTALVPETVKVIAGGATRQGSSAAAIAEAGDAEFILFHDAARPFVSQELITRVIAATIETGAAAAALPVSDTIRRIGDDRTETVDRAPLVAMQTPQGARLDLLREAIKGAVGDETDDMALLEAQGIFPQIVPGDPTNFKLTTPEDLARARAHLGVGETRVGLGYDIHPFSQDSTRTLWLGGVEFPGNPGLEGHSDADVLLHAATDALLGAATLGDIGVHFPNNDPRWRGAPSLHFLRHARECLAAEGWQIVNLDIACIAETPKIMPKALEMRTAIASALQVTIDRVSVKATTNERLGSIGRSEGIAAFATATVVRV